MKRIKKLSITTIFFVFMLLLVVNKSNAATQYSELNDKWFYIKNAYTGHYLDVDNGFGQNDINVQQCQYNGSYAQRWYIHHIGNGEYMIFTEAGSTTSNGTTTVKYALDIYNGWAGNGTNIQIYEGTMGNFAQAFSFEKTKNSTYIIRTKASNYNSVVSLSNNVCSDGVNIHEWEYSNHSHDQWILEPVYQQYTMGISYAEANYDSHLDAYPEFRSPYYDCTNFVSQCLLAGGQLHQSGDWYIKRKNTNYHEVSNNTQLDNSWSLADPSPWISADKFRKYFSSERRVAYYSGADIINKYDEVWKLDIMMGDVIQTADNIFGAPFTATHSAYITGYKNVNIGGVSKPIYSITYHSNNQLNKSLVEFILDGDYLEKIIVFYNFT